jgi:hypothetical protein
MTAPQFDARVTSKDGRHLLFIRGPVDCPEDANGMAMMIRIVTVEEMGKWQRVWIEEGGDGIERPSMA